MQRSRLGPSKGGVSTWVHYETCNIFLMPERIFIHWNQIQFVSAGMETFPPPKKETVCQKTISFMTISPDATHTVLYSSTRMARAWNSSCNT